MIWRTRKTRWLLWTVVAAGLLATYLAWAQPTQQAYTPDNLIRLHIIANSDDPADQAVKREVRDRLLADLTPRLAGVEDLEEAREMVRASLKELAGTAGQVLAKAGFPYGARAELGYFTFPTRAYGDLVLPAGRYEAVRVVLGQGAGENWWCVLFPPLCFVDIAGTAEGPARQVLAPVGATPEAERPAVEVRWKVVELLHRSQEYIARRWP